MWCPDCGTNFAENLGMCDLTPNKHHWVCKVCGCQWKELSVKEYELI